jgi:hypothetical protein
VLQILKRQKSEEGRDIMICGDMRMAKVMMDMQLEEAQHVAKRRRLAKEAGAGRRTGIQLRLGQVLYILGHVLVTVGGHLERHGLPQQSL